MEDASRWIPRDRGGALRTALQRPSPSRPRPCIACTSTPMQYNSPRCSRSDRWVVLRIALIARSRRATVPGSKRARCFRSRRCSQRHARRKRNGATAFAWEPLGAAPNRKTSSSGATGARGKSAGPRNLRDARAFARRPSGGAQAAGLDYYNHNLDTAPEFYGEIITTRTYGDRLDTLERCPCRNQGVLRGNRGHGESRAQRAGLIAGLATLDPQPNRCRSTISFQVKGTPLESAPKLDWSEFVRTIACARIPWPRSTVRLSAGRRGECPKAVQALCFLAGANSIFYGDKLLTTGNPEAAPTAPCWKSSGFAPPEPRVLGRYSRSAGAWNPALETFGVVRCLQLLRAFADGEKNISQI